MGRRHHDLTRWTASASSRAASDVKRGGNDALAVLNFLEGTPDIDTNHVFLLGYSYGAIASLSAMNKKKSANQAKCARSVLQLRQIKAEDNAICIAPAEAGRE